MLVIELRAISEETICNEHRNIICPAIPRRSAQKNPLIFLCDFQERLDPFTATNDSLLIENKEGVLYANVLFDVIPRIDHHGMLVNIKLRVCPHIEMCQFLIPFTGISFSSRGNDVKIRWVCHPCIFFRVYLSTIESVVKR